jgi:hypothetical protein
MRNSEATQLKEQETHMLDTATGLSQDAVAKISDCLRHGLTRPSSEHGSYSEVVLDL